MDEALGTLLRVGPSSLTVACSNDVHQRICTSLPDALIIPRLWFEHEQLVLDVFALWTEDNEEAEYTWDVPNAAKIDERVRNLLFLNEPPVERTSLSIAVATMHVRVATTLIASCSSLPQTLNGIGVNEDWLSLALTVFDDETANGFVVRVHAMLAWATNVAQFGPHRPFVVVRLLANCLATRKQPQWILQDALFDWLDTSAHARDDEDAPAVPVLFGHLVRAGLFDYAAYIQRLLVRNEQGVSFSSVGSSFLLCRTSLTGD